MGRTLKVLDSAVLQDNLCNYIDIELVKVGNGQIVHLQNDCWRIELSKQEFMNFADSVCLAAEKLKTLKKKT